MLNEPKQIKSP